jgi:hypothetical protein
MRYLKSIGLFAVVFLTGFVMCAGASSAGTTINFSSLDKNQPFKLSGTLYLAENSSIPCSAIVLVHGTEGIDVRGEFYRETLLSAGIAIFEVEPGRIISTGGDDALSIGRESCCVELVGMPG